MQFPCICSHSSKCNLPLQATHNLHAARSQLPNKVLLAELTGITGDYFSMFGQSIRNIDDLKRDAERINDQRSLY